MSNSTPNRVEENDRGYRRGAVMGLTMAEIMLLLLFCLLLASAGILEDREQRLADTAELLENAEMMLADLAEAQDTSKIRAELTMLNEEVARLRDVASAAGASSPQMPLPDENWSNLNLPRA